MLYAALTERARAAPDSALFRAGEAVPVRPHRFSEQHAFAGDLGAGLRPVAITALETLALAPVQEVPATQASNVPNAISKALAADVGAPERQTQLLDIT